MIRKLCEKCKEGYAPTAESLKQLGLPPGRVEAAVPHSPAAASPGGGKNLRLPAEE